MFEEKIQSMVIKPSTRGWTVTVIYDDTTYGYTAKHIKEVLDYIQRTFVVPEVVLSSDNWDLDRGY